MSATYAIFRSFQFSRAKSAWGILYLIWHSSALLFDTICIVIRILEEKTTKYLMVSVKVAGMIYQNLRFNELFV